VVLLRKNAAGLSNTHGRRTWAILFPSLIHTLADLNKVNFVRLPLNGAYKRHARKLEG